jgi:hypothetical protein
MKRLRRFLLFICLTVLILALIYETITNTVSQTSEITKIIASLLAGIFGALQVAVFVIDRYFPEGKKQNHAVTQQSLSIDEARSEYLNGRSWELMEQEGFWQSHWYIPLKLKAFDETDSNTIDLKRFVILGDAGSGKSTFLRMSMSEAADKFLADPHTSNIVFPFWINLGLSDNPEDAVEMLNYRWQKHGLVPNIETMLSNKRLCLFVDGLDEMPGDENEKSHRIESLKEFIASNHTLPIILTCRTVDYKLNNLDLGLPVLQIENLSDDERSQLVKTRLPSSDVLLKIDANPYLVEMSRTPRNLSLMLNLYEKSKELPTDIRTLYDKFLDLRYSEFQKENGHVTNEDRTELNARLSKLAFRMMLSKRGTAASQNWSRRQIGRYWLKKALAIGFLVIQDDYISFDHQSLQSYFAISEFIDSFKGRRLSKLLLSMGCILFSIPLAVIIPLLLIAMIPFLMYGMFIASKKKEPPAWVIKYMRFTLLRLRFDLLSSFLNFLFLNVFTNSYAYEVIGGMDHNAEIALPTLRHVLYKSNPLQKNLAFTSIFRLTFPNNESAELLIYGLRTPELQYVTLKMVEVLGKDLKYYFPHQFDDIIACIIDVFAHDGIQTNHEMEEVLKPLVNQNPQWAKLNSFFLSSNTSLGFFDVLSYNALFAIGKDAIPTLHSVLEKHYAKRSYRSVSLVLIFLMIHGSSIDIVESAKKFIEFAGRASLDLLQDNAIDILFTISILLAASLSETEKADPNYNSKSFMASSDDIALIRRKALEGIQTRNVKLLFSLLTTSVLVSDFDGDDVFVFWGLYSELSESEVEDAITWFRDATKHGLFPK